MNHKIVLFAAIMAIFPVLAGASAIVSASKVLYATDASFVVKTVGDSVSVVTFDYKTPAETCKFLQESGIPVVTVGNWNKNGVLVSKTC